MSGDSESNTNDEVGQPFVIRRAGSTQTSNPPAQQPPTPKKSQGKTTHANSVPEMMSMYDLKKTVVGTNRDPSRDEEERPGGEEEDYNIKRMRREEFLRRRCSKTMDQEKRHDEEEHKASGPHYRRRGEQRVNPLYDDEGETGREVSPRYTLTEQQKQYLVVHDNVYKFLEAVASVVGVQTEGIMTNASLRNIVRKGNKAIEFVDLTSYSSPSIVPTPVVGSANTAASRRKRLVVTSKTTKTVRKHPVSGVQTTTIEKQNLIPVDELEEEQEGRDQGMQAPGSSSRPIEVSASSSTGPSSIKLERTGGSVRFMEDEDEDEGDYREGVEQTSGGWNDRRKGGGDRGVATTSTNPTAFYSNPRSRELFSDSWAMDILGGNTPLQTNSSITINGIGIKIELSYVAADVLNAAQKILKDLISNKIRGASYSDRIDLMTVIDSDDMRGDFAEACGVEMIIRNASPGRTYYQQTLEFNVARMVGLMTKMLQRYVFDQGSRRFVFSET